MSAYTLFLVLLCLCVGVCPPSGDPGGTKCEAVEGAPTCVCRTPHGVIDLTKIASFDGTPRFTGMKDPNDFTYDYNPCAPFTTPEGCVNPSHVCQNGIQELADYGTEQMYYHEADLDPYVYYTGPGGSFKQVFVYLICDVFMTGEPKIETIGDSNTYLKYEFWITSCHCCPGGCAS